MAVPVLVLLVLGIAEFGRAWMARNVLTGAAREAARIAAVQGRPEAAAARAGQILEAAGLRNASVSLADDGTPYGVCTVTVTWDCPLLVANFLPGLSGGAVRLSGSTSMRKEY